MSAVRWYVVTERDLYEGEDRDAKEVWTLSLSPDWCGWNTDSGYPGYGLTKALAQELADAANEAWNRSMDRLVPIEDETLNQG